MVKIINKFRSKFLSASMIAFICYFFLRPEVDLEWWGGGPSFLLFLTIQSALISFCAFILYLRDIEKGITSRKNYFEIDNFFGKVYSYSFFIVFIFGCATIFASLPYLFL